MNPPPDEVKALAVIPAPKRSSFVAVMVTGPLSALALAPAAEFAPANC
jgi:hypothetical protein